MADAPILTVNGLQAWYGESHILHGVTFDVREGEVVTLLGRNGAGKTTTLKSIMGIVGQRSGAVQFRGPRTDWTFVECHCPLRHRLLSRGARHFREPRCRRRTFTCRPRSRRAV